MRRGVAAVAMGIALWGCGGPRVPLGPPSTKYLHAEPAKQRVVAEMRAWLASLPEDKAAELDRVKEVTFSFQEVQAAQPTRAARIAEYVQTLQKAVDRQAQEKGLEAPRLSPQRVIFQDLGQRSYQCVFDLGEGNRSNLLLAETQ